MRLQSIKLLILIVAILAGAAVAGRLAWFLYVGRQQILRAPNDQQPSMGINWWWDNYRKDMLARKPVGQVGPKVKPEDYNVIGLADVSGEIPPKPIEPEKTKTPTDKIPYDGFRFVLLKSFFLGDGKHEGDDHVFLKHEVQPPRAHLKDAGKITERIYRVGESLEPLPEIKIERIDREKSEVVFRVPLYKDIDGRYENYKGTEEDSQLKTIALGELVAVPLNAADGSSGEDERNASRPKPEATLSDGRKAPKTTQETYPGSGVWMLGTEDLNEWEKDWSERLEREVSVASYNRNGVTGLHVQRIDESSPFFGRGIMKNDVILSLNGHKIPTKSSAVRYIRENSEKRNYTVSILRNGRTRQLLFQVPR